MATTAAVTLTSDLLSDALSVSTTTTCTKAGTTADGLDWVETKSQPEQVLIF